MLSALQVITGPEKEPVDLEEAKAHTRIAFDADDALVKSYMLAARCWAENYLARVLITQTLQWTLAHTPPPGGWPLISVPNTLFILPLWFDPDLLWSRPVELPRQPVQSVQSVSVETWDGGTETVLTPDQYTLNLPVGRLRLLSGRGAAPNGSITVTFTAGYGDAPENVPEPIRVAIMMMTAFLFEQRGDTGGTSPAAAEMLLAPYRQVTFGG